MEPYQALTENILAGQGGRTTAAFFDLDGTIIATHSVKDIFIERLMTGQVDTDEAVDMVTMMAKYLFKMGDFVEGMKASVANMAGAEEQEFVELTEKVTRDRLIPQIFPFFRQDIL